MFFFGFVYLFRNYVLVRLVPCVRATRDVEGYFFMPYFFSLFVVFAGAVYVLLGDVFGSMRCSRTHFVALSRSGANGVFASVARSAV